MTFCVALTGSVASGKSSALSYFKALDVGVFSADDINRHLLTQQKTIATIAHYFGDSVINEQGELNKRQLRRLIFSDPQKKRWLENLMHPLIRQQFELAVNTSSQPYTVIEIPLLNALNDYPYINRVLLIVVDKTTQLNRLMHRDNIDHQQALAMVENHSSLEAKLALADDVIHNNDTPEKFQQQLQQIHHNYLKLANMACSGRDHV